MQKPNATFFSVGHVSAIGSLNRRDQDNSGGLSRRDIRRINVGLQKEIKLAAPAM